MRKNLLPVGRMWAARAFAGRLGWLLSGWLLSGWLWLWPHATADAQPQPAAQGLPPARVAVAEVQRNELDARQTFVGTVMPLRTSTVSSSVEGLVVDLKVDEGAYVKKGDTLAQLRDDQPLLAKAAAEAELDVRTHELNVLSISLPEEIKQADARMMAAKAIMEFTARRLRRTRQLVASQTISEDELQEKESVALAAQEKYREAQTALGQAQATLAVKLKQADARVKAQQKEVDRLKDDLAQHQITAPFDGYVTEKQTEVGQWITKGGPVVEVVELSYVEVEVPVLESYLSQLHLSMKATVTIGALPGESWPAPVVAIVPQADVRSRSFPVKVRLKNRPGPGGVLFKPGMFARVTLPVYSKPQAILVPKDAMVLGGPSPVVFVVDPMPNGPPRGPSGGSPADRPLGGSLEQTTIDGTARKVPIEVDLEAAEGRWIEVRGPLKPGELVVVEGNERLLPGQPVVIVRRDPPQPKAPVAKPTK